MVAGRAPGWPPLAAAPPEVWTVWTADDRAVLAWLDHHLRSDLKAARISSLKSFGCSQAAKWPPLSTSLK